MNQTIETNTEIRPDTKQRILDAAERLFAENGIAGTSLRMIIADAGVNLAAIHYHFQNKEVLLDAVLNRRMTPLNEKRLALLDAAEEAAGDGPLDLDAVIHAFVAPTIHYRFDPKNPGIQHFARMMARILAETGGNFPQLAKKNFPVLVQRFQSAFQRAMPGLEQEQIMLRIFFSVGVMAFTLLNFQEEQFGFHRLSPDQLIREMVNYMSSGFRSAIGEPAISAESETK